MLTRARVTGSAAIALLLLASVLPARAQLPADQMKTLSLPEPAPNWVFVLDGQYPVMMISKLHIIDGDSRKLLGQVFGGYASNFELSPDHRELYMIDTYYTRATRGTRTDVVSIFDAKTLNWLGEVEIPPKRLLIVPKDNTTALTPDGRFLFVANMTPATSVSVVDLKARKFVGEIDTPGCAQVLVAGDRSFASMCADGSLMTVVVDDSGKLKSRKQGKPFFDPSKDPVFDQPVVVGGKAYFVSYHGAIHVVDLSGDEAKGEAEWSMLTPADQKEKWRPGGWQVIAAGAGAKELYVMMHQGGEWTHKQFGTEVWVLDAQKRARIARVKLKSDAYSINVSQGPKPLLYALDLLKSQLETYALPSGKYEGVFKELGTPFLVYRP